MARSVGPSVGWFKQALVQHLPWVGSSYLLGVVGQYRRHKAAVGGFLFLLALLLTAAVGPYLVPHDPYRMDLSKITLAPSWLHPLGTDEVGRDLLSRLVEGSRFTLLLSLASVALAVSLGLWMGVVAGYYGGWIDTVLSRLLDVWMALPGFLIAIAVIAILGPGLYNVVFAVGAYTTPHFARLARGSVLAQKGEDYVLAARAVGVGNRRIMWRHVLPNILAPIIVQFTLRLATAILTVSALSFLGLGAQPPSPEWGVIISTGRNFIWTSPHLVVFPGVAIMLTVLAFNLVGDGLRDSLDPRLRH